MNTNTTFIVVPTSEAFEYWVKHLCPSTAEYAYEHEEEFMDGFDRWITWLCGELLDGTDIQYMFHHTSQVARRLIHFKIPYRVVAANGDERYTHQPEGAYSAQAEE
jgi:hypothetical protein